MHWKVLNNNTKISTFSRQPLLMSNDLLACENITSPCFLLRDEVLQAREAQRSRFELAKDKHNNALRKPVTCCFCHCTPTSPPSRGLEVTTMELVLESELKVVFKQVHYRDRNFALIKKEGGIMLHLGTFTKAKHTGHETIPVQVILIITSSSYANKSRVCCGIFPWWQIALPSSFPIKVQTTW